jgi:hypothetical protein
MMHVCFFRIERGKFHEIISKLQKFITCRLFPERPEDLPPITKSAWWIPSATKVLALLSKLRLLIVGVGQSIGYTASGLGIHQAANFAFPPFLFSFQMLTTPQ